MSRSATKHGDEVLAALVIAGALNAPVVKHDDGPRPRMYDLQINYPAGRHGAVEVVSTRDKATWALASAETSRGYVRCPDLSRLWIITVEPGARVNEIARAAPTLLAQLEENDIDRASSDFSGSRTVQLLLTGVATCGAIPPTERHPPGFYIIPFPTGAWVGDGNSVVQTCDDFLMTVPDVSAKLLGSGLAERHAVVIVTPDWLGPMTAIEDGATPTITPSLPAGVDCLWLMPATSTPVRAIYWLGDGQWREFTLPDSLLGND